MNIWDSVGWSFDLPIIFLSDFLCYSILFIMQSSQILWYPTYVAWLLSLKSLTYCVPVLPCLFVFPISISNDSFLFPFPFFPCYPCSVDFVKSVIILIILKKLELNLPICLIRLGIQLFLISFPILFPGVGLLRTSNYILLPYVFHHEH